MIKGSKRENIDLKEFILSKVDDYNIIKHYLGQDFDFKKKFHSPFRQDSNPNLGFFIGKGDAIYFKDFATGKGGDCFKFVQLIFNLNYFEALKKVDEDFNLGRFSKNRGNFKIKISKRPDSTTKKSNIIQIVPRDFTDEDLEYWNSYEITLQELKNKNVYSVERFYLNKNLMPGNKMRFAYLFDNQYIKVYTPKDPKFKWISTCPNDLISGFDNIKFKIFKGEQSKRLIISKSVKDEIVLSKFFTDVCSTQNESKEAINQENLKWILRGYKPEDVYISYDNDEAGIRSSTYFTKNYGFNYVNVPNIYRREGIKDWSDLVQEKGLDTMENYLKIKNLI
jgi:hypothetical protein